MITSNTSRAFSLLMLVAGIGIPVGASLNSTLGTNIGSPALAASILFFVGLVVSLSMYFFSTEPGLQKLFSVKWYYFTGGLFIALYVISITWAAPRIGIGNAVFLVLLGQILSAMTIDHLGLFGAKIISLNLERIAGAVLMIIGIFLTRRGG